MAEFTLDTSGAIYGQSDQWGGTCVFWSGLSPFAQGYVEAALRSVYWYSGPQIEEMKER